MKIKPRTNLFLILSTISIFGGMALLLTLAHAQEGQTETNSNTPEFLAIQHSESGSMSKINTTTYSLHLNDLSNKIILFSNRPDRIVVTQSIQDFIGNWTGGQDSFQKDPPNAALIVLTENKKQDIFEIELLNPKYDKDQNMLKYNFTFLGNATLSDSPTNLGKSVLLIDSVSGWPLQYSGN